MDYTSFFDTYLKDLSYQEIAYLFLPMILGFLVGFLCPVGKDAGVIVPARPPSVAFSIIWPILYFMIGLSWIVTRRNKPSEQLTIDIMYFLLVGVLCLWSFVYGCMKCTNEHKKYALYVIFMAMLVTLVALLYDQSNLLLTPLFVWLIYASMLNFTEVNYEAITTASLIKQGLL